MDVRSKTPASFPIRPKYDIPLRRNASFDNAICLMITMTGTQVTRDSWISLIRLNKDPIKEMGFTHQAYINRARNVALDTMFKKHGTAYGMMPTASSVLYPALPVEIWQEGPHFAYSGGCLYYNIPTIMRMRDPFLRLTPLDGCIEEFADRVRKHGFKAEEFPERGLIGLVKDEQGIITLGDGECENSPGVTLCMIASWPTLHINFVLSQLSMNLKNVTKILIWTKDHHGAADMPVARTALVKKAMDEDPNSEYVFFFDVDMQVGHNTIDYLVKQEKDVIGAVYYQRGEPYFPHTGTIYANPLRLRRITDFPIETNMPFRVDAQGTGALLIHKDVFKKLDYPWFRFDMIENKYNWAEDRFIGEDYQFSWDCHQAGIEMFADGSVPTTHICDMMVDQKLAYQFKHRWRE